MRKLTDVCDVVIISIDMQSMWHVKQILSPLSFHISRLTIVCDDGAHVNRPETSLREFVVRIESLRIPDSIGTMKDNDTAVDIERHR